MYNCEKWRGQTRVARDGGGGSGATLRGPKNASLFMFMFLVIMTVAPISAALSASSTPPHFKTLFVTLISLTVVPFSAALVAPTPPPFKDVVSTSWLARRLGVDADLKVVDVRGKVLKNEISPGEFVTTYCGEREAYLSSHIPSAVFVDWTKDISCVSNGIEAQLAPPEQFITEMEMRGITLQKHIVIYDDGRCLFATRLWWALR